jgi:hypothetical protein
MRTLRAFRLRHRHPGGAGSVTDTGTATDTVTDADTATVTGEDSVANSATVSDGGVSDQR